MGKKSAVEGVSPLFYPVYEINAPFVMVVACARSLEPRKVPGPLFQQREGQAHLSCIFGVSVRHNVT